MQYYEEIRLLPGEEISLAFLWTKVFTQVHVAFASYKNQHGTMPFAVSFPAYTEDGLGNKLRIFASDEAEMEALALKQYLARLTDYIQLLPIRRIPRARIKGYAVFGRCQPDGSAERKARRYTKRHENVSYEEALGFFQKKKAMEHLPYIQLKSLSSGERFSLFIQKKEVSEEQAGVYGSYGLSVSGTVPVF